MTVSPTTRCERFKEARGMMHVKQMINNHPNDFQLLRAAFGLLRNLSCVSPKQREFVAEKHEMIPVIMSAMKRHHTHPILCRNACSALSSLCAEPVYAWEVRFWLEELAAISHHANNAFDWPCALQIAKRGGVKMAIMSLEVRFFL